MIRCQRTDQSLNRNSQERQLVPSHRWASAHARDRATMSLEKLSAGGTDISPMSNREPLGGACRRGRCKSRHRFRRRTSTSRSAKSVDRASSCRERRAAAANRSSEVASFSEADESLGRREIQSRMTRPAQDPGWPDPIARRAWTGFASSGCRRRGGVVRIGCGEKCRRQSCKRVGHDHATRGAADRMAPFRATDECGRPCGGLRFPSSPSDLRLGRPVRSSEPATTNSTDPAP